MCAMIASVVAVVNHFLAIKPQKPAFAKRLLPTTPVLRQTPYDKTAYHAANHHRPYTANHRELKNTRELSPPLLWLVKVRFD